MNTIELLQRLGASPATRATLSEAELAQLREEIAAAGELACILLVPDEIEAETV